MKLLIIANNANWNSWPKKISQLKSWFAPKIDLVIEIEHTNYQSIPFIYYVSNDPAQNKSVPLLGVDPKWYDYNVTTLAEGYDMVLFVIPMIQWGYADKARGWRTDRDQGPIELQIGCDELQVLTQGDGTGLQEAFFQLARHEILHALFMITGQLDTTHKWWNIGKIENTLVEVNIPVAKTTDNIGKLTAMLQAIQGLLNSFNIKIKIYMDQNNKIVTEPIKSYLEDWAKAIQEFEGWTVGQIVNGIKSGGTISWRQNNPGNLRYSPYQTGTNHGFSIFNSYAEGFNALVHQLRLAATGKSKVYKPTMTLVDFFRTYAPASDNNYPEKYATFVAQRLGVDSGILIKDLA